MTPATRHELKRRYYEGDEEVTGADACFFALAAGLLCLIIYMALAL